MSRLSHGPGADGMTDKPDGARWWTRPIWIGVGALVVCVAAVVGAVWAFKSVDDPVYGDFYESLVGPLLTFTSAVLVAGVVGVAVSAARDRRGQERKDADKQAEIEREHRAFLESQIVALWSVHDRLKTSAVLISAHQTAKTYSEQMKEIISARARLSDIGDTIERQKRPLVTDAEFRKFRKKLDVATSFLHPLVDEYRENYLKKVSYAQLVDEARNKHLNEAFDRNPSRRSTLAWKSLQDERNFPALRKVSDFGGLEASDLEKDSRAWMDAQMTKEFFKPLRCAIEILVKCRRPPEGP
jgi:uncharacterized membrane protein